MDSDSCSHTCRFMLGLMFAAWFPLQRAAGPSAKHVQLVGVRVHEEERLPISARLRAVCPATARPQPLSRRDDVSSASRHMRRIVGIRWRQDRQGLLGRFRAHNCKAVKLLIRQNNTTICALPSRSAQSEAMRLVPSQCTAACLHACVHLLVARELAVCLKGNLGPCGTQGFRRETGLATGGGARGEAGCRWESRNTVVVPRTLRALVAITCCGSRPTPAGLSRGRRRPPAWLAFVIGGLGKLVRAQSQWTSDGEGKEEVGMPFTEGASLREDTTSGRAAAGLLITTCGWLIQRDEVTGVITRRPTQGLTGCSGCAIRAGLIAGGVCVGLRCEGSLRVLLTRAVMV